MRKLVQLRGTTGAGKTTCMRGFIERLGGAELGYVNGSKAKRGVMRSEHWTILGDYENQSACTGCDRFSNRDDLMAVLKSVLRERPENIAFEGMIYSHTFQLASDINDLARKHGYEYVPVFLNTSYETALSRVTVRNGGKKINEETLVSKILAFRVAREKIRRSGIKIIDIDSDSLSAEQVADRFFEVATR